MSNGDTMLKIGDRIVVAGCRAMGDMFNGHHGTIDHVYENDEHPYFVKFPQSTPLTRIPMHSFRFGEREVEPCAR